MSYVQWKDQPSRGPRSASWLYLEIVLKTCQKAPASSKAPKARRLKELSKSMWEHVSTNSRTWCRHSRICQSRHISFQGDCLANCFQPAASAPPLQTATRWVGWPAKYLATWHELYSLYSNHCSWCSCWHKRNQLLPRTLMCWRKGSRNSAFSWRSPIFTGFAIPSAQPKCRYLMWATLDLRCRKSPPSPSIWFAQPRKGWGWCCSSSFFCVRHCRLTEIDILRTVSSRAEAQFPRWGQKEWSERSERCSCFLSGP